jgi:hypothetical protein
MKTYIRKKYVLLCNEIVKIKIIFAIFWANKVLNCGILKYLFFKKSNGELKCHVGCTKFNATIELLLYFEHQE